MVQGSETGQEIIKGLSALYHAPNKSWDYKGKRNGIKTTKSTKMQLKNLELKHGQKAGNDGMIKPWNGLSGKGG